MPGIGLPTGPGGRGEVRAVHAFKLTGGRTGHGLHSEVVQAGTRKVGSSDGRASAQLRRDGRFLLRIIQHLSRNQVSKVFNDQPFRDGLLTNG